MESHAGKGELGRRSDRFYPSDRGESRRKQASKRSLANLYSRDYSPSSFENRFEPADGNSIPTDRFRSQILIMAVRIRMKRIGTTNTPAYRIVVADSRSPRDGKFIEEIGTYQPLRKSDNFTVDVERADYLLSKGAQTSETVASFLKKARKAKAAAA